MTILFIVSVLLASLLGASTAVHSFMLCSSVQHAREPIFLLAQPNAITDTANGLTKIEGAAVKRFTVTYDKLCKACPTRLQPRVDTLTEMILGLPDDERARLMDTVAKRLEEGNEVQPGVVNGDSSQSRVIKSSQDVYDFQTTGAAVKVKQGTKAETDNMPISNNVTMDNDQGEEERIDVVDIKLLKKMKKARVKFDANKQKLVKSRRLLAITNALLAKDACKTEPTIYTISNPMDNAWYHDVDELKALSRKELKMERLKLSAQRAKYESKVAKGRLKLYKASVDLMDHVK